jgi:hypothetical protein
LPIVVQLQAGQPSSGSCLACCWQWATHQGACADEWHLKQWLQLLLQVVRPAACFSQAWGWGWHAFSGEVTHSLLADAGEAVLAGRAMHMVCSGCSIEVLWWSGVVLLLLHPVCGQWSQWSGAVWLWQAWLYVCRCRVVTCKVQASHASNLVAGGLLHGRGEVLRLSVSGNDNDTQWTTTAWIACTSRGITNKVSSPTLK